jgi:hypothetical protein
VNTILDGLKDDVVDKVITLINDPIIDKIISDPTKQPPPKPPKNPKVPSKQTGLTWPQATEMAGSFGVPQLANVFYYGKDFGGKKQKVDPTGELMMPPYHEISVTKAGAEPEPEAIPVAQEAKADENDISALLQQIMSSGDNNTTQEELMQIIQARG